MNISIGQNCLNKKNPFEYIVLPPSRGVGKTIGFPFKCKNGFFLHFILTFFKFLTRCGTSYSLSFIIAGICHFSCLVVNSDFLLHLESVLARNNS